MTIIDNIVLNSILIFFPISIYLNYTTYINNLEIKEKSIILEFTIIAIALLLLIYNQSNSITFLITLSIPSLVSLKRKDYKTYFLLTIITLIFNHKLRIINNIILLIKYIVYIPFFIKISNKKILSLIIFIIESMAILLIKNKYLSIEIINIITAIIFQIIAINLIISAIHKGSKMIELNNILKELEREKLLRSSISKLTHELKNPIAVCKGYLEMMNLKDQEKSQKYLTIITNEISRSKTIIDEFSDYGKLKQVEKEEMDLSYLFEDIKEVLEPLFKKNKSKLTINVKSEIYIKGDYNKLKQVFINLLKNTLEAKKESTPLIAEIKVTESKNTITVKVKDNGIGMSKETLSHVSEVFFTTKQNGTGIGLAFSKEVIELHQGTISIKSEFDQGTTITIKLPK